MFEYLGSEGWNLINTNNLIDSESKNVGLKSLNGNNFKVFVSTVLIDYIFKRELKGEPLLSAEATKIKDIFQAAR